VLLHTRKADVRLFYSKKQEKASDVLLSPNERSSPDDYAI
jgi:hypothetical protein